MVWILPCQKNKKYKEDSLEELCLSIDKRKQILLLMKEDKRNIRE